MVFSLARLQPPFSGRTHAQITAAAYGSSLFGYYPLLGDVNDYSGNGFHGTNNGANLTGGTFKTGEACAFFDGVNDHIALPAAGLDVPFNGLEGTLSAWVKVFDVGVWTDGVNRRPINIAVDGSANRIVLNRNGLNNQLSWFYQAGGTTDQVSATLADQPLSWLHMALTWSKSADQMIAYLNGAQTGSTQTGLGTWAGALNPSLCVIGQAATSGGNPWYGYIAHAALGNRALTPAEIASIGGAA